MEINILLGVGGWEDQDSYLVQGTLFSWYTWLSIVTLESRVRVTPQFFFQPWLSCQPWYTSWPHNNKARDATKCPRPSLVAENVDGEERRDTSGEVRVLTSQPQPRHPGSGASELQLRQPCAQEATRRRNGTSLSLEPVSSLSFLHFSEIVVQVLSFAPSYLF